MREGWTETKIDDVLEFTIGGVWGVEPDLDEVNVKVVRSTEFRASGILFHESAVDRSIKMSQLLSRRLIHGDILLEKSGGGPEQPVGRVVFVNNDIPSNTVCSNFVQLVRPDSSKILPRYLFLTMWKWHFEDRTLQFQAQTTGIRNLRTPDYLAQALSLPPIPEQKRIVDLISSVDSYIDALEQQAESARKSRSAVLQEMLSAGGDDWTETTLGEVADVRDGTHDSPKQTPDGYTLVTSKNITNGKLDLDNSYQISRFDYDEINKRSKVDLYDILISMIGTVGQAIQITSVPSFAIKNVGLIKTNDSELSSYLVLFLNSRLGQDEIIKNVSGSTQKFIGLGKLRTLKVIVPPRQERKRIVDLISSMDDGIFATEKLISDTKQLRSGLLSDLLSGEHEIPESYDKVMGTA